MFSWFDLKMSRNSTILRSEAFGEIANIFKLLTSIWFRSYRYDPAQQREEDWSNNDKCDIMHTRSSTPQYQWCWCMVESYAHCAHTRTHMHAHCAHHRAHMHNVHTLVLICTLRTPSYSYAHCAPVHTLVLICTLCAHSYSYAHCAHPRTHMHTVHTLVLICTLCTHIPSYSYAHYYSFDEALGYHFRECFVGICILIVWSTETAFLLAST